MSLSHDLSGGVRKIRSTTSTTQQVYLDLIKKFGHIGVNSGYRSPSHNKAVGGAKKSQHIHRRAIDLQTAGMSKGDRDALLRELASDPRVGGVGLYPSGNIHFDTRPRGKNGTLAIWGSDYSSASAPRALRIAAAQAPRRLGNQPSQAYAGLSGDMAKYAAAISKIESGSFRGDYNTRGPVVKKGRYAGERALGRYQVMPGNLAAWTRKAIGRSVSEAEFLRSRDIQDAVFANQFASSIKRYGSPSDAASVWFTGRPTSNPSAGKASDGGTTGNRYVAMFKANLREVERNPKLAQGFMPRSGEQRMVTRVVEVPPHQWTVDQETRVKNGGPIPTRTIQVPADAPSNNGGTQIAGNNTNYSRDTTQSDFFNSLDDNFGQDLMSAHGTTQQNTAASLSDSVRKKAGAENLFGKMYYGDDTFGEQSVT